MYGYIYKTTNTVNGFIYVGQHKSRKFTPSYKGSGTLITGAILKFGQRNFIVELIQKCDNQEELDLAEQYWINYYHSTDPRIGYNQSIGGRDNDIKESYRTDADAYELRQIAQMEENKKKHYTSKNIKRVKRINNPSNWVIIYKDGKTREVFIDNLKNYLKCGWKVEES